MVSPDPTAPSHESLRKWWWLAEFIPKQHFNWTQKKLSYHVNLGRRRVIPPHSLVHNSAYRRSASEIDKLPTDAIEVTTSYDKTARIWHAASAKQIAVLRGHDDAVLSAAFSPDGSRIVTASASYDKTARIWDAVEPACPIRSSKLTKL
jgi:WD40 repeat protein